MVVTVAAQAGEGPSNFEIVSLSNRADLVSGGDALLEVRVPKNVPLNQVTLRLPPPPVSHPRPGHDHDDGDRDNGRDHHDRDDD